MWGIPYSFVAELKSRSVKIMMMLNVKPIHPSLKRLEDETISAKHTYCAWGLAGYTLKSPAESGLRGVS